MTSTEVQHLKVDQQKIKQLNVDQQKVEELKAEAEEEDEGEKERPEQLDLIGKDWNTHIPAGGLMNFGGYGNTHGSALGQEPIFYRKSTSDPFSF